MSDYTRSPIDSKAVENICVEEKFVLRSTHNPVLALTALRTARPWSLQINKTCKLKESRVKNIFSYSLSWVLQILQFQYSHVHLVGKATVQTKLLPWEKSNQSESFVNSLTFIDTENVNVNSKLTFICSLYIDFIGECIWLHIPLIKSVLEFCRKLFPIVSYGYTTIPTYPSGQIGFILCSKSKVRRF